MKSRVTHFDFLFFDLLMSTVVCAVIVVVAVRAFVVNVATRWNMPFARFFQVFSYMYVCICLYVCICMRDSF